MVQKLPRGHGNLPEEINNEPLPPQSLPSTYTDPATPETHQAHSHLGPLQGLFPVPGTLPQIPTGQLTRFLHTFTQISPSKRGLPRLSYLQLHPDPSLCSGCSFFYCIYHFLVYYIIRFTMLTV